MADIQLNLIYNDNGAQKRVDNLVSELQRLENRQWRINLSGIGQSFASQLETAAKKFEEVTTSVYRKYGRGSRDLDAGLSDLEKVLSRLNGKIDATRLKMLELLTSPKSGQKVATYDVLNKELSELEKHAENVKAKIDEINADPAAKEFQKLSSELSATNVQTEKISESLADSIGETFGPAKYIDEWEEVRKELNEYQKEREQDRREQTKRQEEEAKKQAQAEQEKAKKIATAQNMVAQGYHQTWRGIQQTVSGVINTLTSTYNTWKSVVEAPLNLTGVSSLVSMLELMEGSLILNRITSNITTGFSEGVERYDILMSFPAVMENIGYSTDQATAAMDRLYQSVLGLPTSFGDIVQTTQFFTLVLDDLEKATDLAIAANNAFVASGADSQQISSGMRQLQYILEGTKLRSTQWYSLIRSMPLALREVGDALGYPDFSAFTADMMAGKIASEDLIDTLIDVGLNSEKLGGIIDVMKSRISAALDNVTNAGRRMGEGLLKTLDEVLTREGGKGIAENIKGVSAVIDHITEVSSQWISDHGQEIQGLIDKFFSIDWASVVPGFLEGLVEIADKALDNIDEWITDIGGIISDVRTLFNDFENSQFVKALTGGSGILSGITQSFAGLANIFAGMQLVRTGSALAGSVGASSALPTIGSIWSGSIISSTLPYIAGIVASIYSVNKVIEWNTRQKEENEEFVESEEVENEVKSLSGQYMRLVVSGSTDYQLLNAIADNIYAYSGQEVVIPYVFSPEDLVDAVNAAARVFDDSDISKKLSSRSYVDILLSELDSISTDIPITLMSSWDNIWEGYQNRLDDVAVRANRIKQALEDLENETDKWNTATIEDMAKIYGGKDGEGGKFFSEQVKEAFGGLYRNTRSDYLEVQTNAGQLITEVNDQVIQAIEGLPEGERSKYFEAWANYLGSVDLTDASTIAQLQKINEEGGQQILNTFLIPQAQLDEVMNNNTTKIKEMRKAAFEAAGEDLTDEEQGILDEAGKDPAFNEIGKQLISWAKKMSDVYLPLLENELGEFSDDVIKLIQEMINRINSREFYINPNINYNEARARGGQTAPLATGGFLFAPKGTDTIPAMLTPGEYVQRRAAVEHFGKAFMDRINNLDLRGALRSLSMNYATPYSTGGYINSDNRSYRDNHATVNQIFKSANASTGFRRASRYVRALG